MTYYKILNEDGTCYHGGIGRWPLPIENADGSWTPGEWMPEIKGELIPCLIGYHGCTREQLVEWFGPAIFEMEYSGEVIDVRDKVIGRRARLLCKLEGWDERVARLFACDCAERVLPIFERQYPNDKRPRLTIETARNFANGLATEDELAVAGDAALAARDAAWDAERYAERYAARDAAWAAAEAVARYAARAAAWAARAAAWSAAEAVARDAARATARAAAWDAEREWQIARLFEYLEARGKSIAGELQ